MVFSSPNLKMALGDAKIHLSESNQREVPLGQHPYRLSIPCRDILEEVLLLVWSYSVCSMPFSFALAKLQIIIQILHTSGIKKDWQHLLMQSALSV
jgi:hypothetical protein